MEYRGVIITGTSGAGKSTVAKELCKRFGIYQQVQSTTTRGKRSDDAPGTYEYLSKEEFSSLEKKNKFIVTSTYRGEKYGIKVEYFEKVLSEGKVPIMILTPEAADQLDKTSKDKFMIIFLDASDDTLNEWLKKRGGNLNAVHTQRKIDRKYKNEMWKRDSCPIYCMRNENTTSIDDIVNLIHYFYEYRNTGGLLPKRLIELMIKCGMLLEDAEIKNIQGASYDLTLGDVYWQNGEKRKLNERNSFIELKPGGYVLVASKEIANFSKDIAGRFDLSVSLFCQGVILSNGPQVDPGFNGGLFCLLFNTSDENVILKRGQHHATIEFIKLLEPTVPYFEKYQGKTDIIDFLPKPAKPSAIVKLKEDVDKLKSEKTWERTLPIILSALAIVATIVMGVILFFIKK